MNFRGSCAFQTRTPFRLPCTQIAVMWANNFDKICSFEKKRLRLTRACTVAGLLVGRGWAQQVWFSAPERETQTAGPFSSRGPWRSSSAHHHLQSLSPAWWPTHRKNKQNTKHISFKAFYSFIISEFQKHLLNSRSCAECRTGIKKKLKIFTLSLKNCLLNQSWKLWYKCLWNSRERANLYLGRERGKAGRILSLPSDIWGYWGSANFPFL